MSGFFGMEMYRIMEEEGLDVKKVSSIKLAYSIKIFKDFLDNNKIKYNNKERCYKLYRFAYWTRMTSYSMLGLFFFTVLLLMLIAFANS
jgi:hypothetical protein